MVCVTNKQSVMGIDFVNVTMATFKKEIYQRIADEKRTFIVTANPEILMYSEQDEKYRDILHQADYVMPDGVGVIIAAKLLRTPLVERLTGFDFFMELLEHANQTHLTAYFLGAKQEVLEKALTRLNEKYPQLQIVGSHHGYFGHDDAIIKQEIEELKPDIILLALGYPRQEKWIHDNLPHFSKGLFIGLGGSFDVFAGEVKRAPKLWQKLNLEWLYRLIKQPTRWRRMLALPKFLFKVLKTRRENK